MTKSQLKIAAMLKKAGRKVHVIDESKSKDEPIFRNCNVCGRGLVRADELATGMCAICANEEV